MILYYSGCGNSKHIAIELARLTNDEINSLLEFDPGQPVSLNNGVLGIVCPIYAWAAPRLVEKRLQQIQWIAPPTYCYLACTCGDSLGRAPEHFARKLKRMGLHLDAAFGFIMPETYINLPGFHLDSSESEQRKYDTVRQRLPHVAEQIREQQHMIDVKRGPVPRITTYVVNPIFYGLIITDKKFHVTESCIGCSVCERNCPLHNISMQDGHPQWHGNCTNCMGCYHRCPTNAIHFGKATVGKGQYKLKIEN